MVEAEATQRSGHYWTEGPGQGAAAGVATRAEGGADPHRAAEAEGQQPGGGFREGRRGLSRVLRQWGGRRRVLGHRKVEKGTRLDNNTAQSTFLDRDGEGLKGRLGDHCLGAPVKGHAADRLDDAALNHTIVGKRKEVGAGKGRVTAHADTEFSAGRVADQLELGRSSGDSLGGPHVYHGTLTKGQEGELFVEDRPLSFDKLVRGALASATVREKVEQGCTVDREEGVVLHGDDEREGCKDCRTTVVVGLDIALHPLGMLGRGGK